MRKEQSINSIVGLRIGFVRRREGLSQSDLAKEIGMTRIMLSNIESGRVPLKLITAWKISQIVGVHPNWFHLGGDDSQLFPHLPKDEFERLDKIYTANKDAVFADTWDTLGVLLFDAEQRTRLTSISLKGNTPSVKSEIERLIDRVKRKAEAPGAKADLARKLDVAPARISEWLSGTKEPGGDYTLRLLRWVSEQGGLIK